MKWTLYQIDSEPVPAADVYCIRQGSFEEGGDMDSIPEDCFVAPLRRATVRSGLSDGHHLIVIWNVLIEAMRISTISHAVPP